MRRIDPAMDASVVAAIDGRLDAVERDEQVAILWAIESGSRAWGFPSPDSDYDCRFVYLRRRRDYLGLFPRRDVIETPLDAVLDVNGWDLHKALRLLVKGNAVVIEWFLSPIVYRGDPAFRDRFVELAGVVAVRRDIARHYFHLGREMLRRVTTETDVVPLKKAFYALRPALALRWLRLNPQQPLAPMHFPTLCSDADLSPFLRAEIDALLALKARTREMGQDKLPGEITELLARELTVDGIAPLAGELPESERQELANRFFLAEVDRAHGE
jgi:predicted nucleotidyltransferase